MSSPLILDEELHAAAVKAKIQTALDALADVGADPVQVLDLDDVYDDTATMPARPDEYVEVLVYRRYGGTPRADGFIGTCGWRVTTRVVARYVTSARTLRKAVTDALLNQNLTVSGQQTTPVLFETEEPVDEDDDYYVGFTDWTYTL